MYKHNIKMKCKYEPRCEVYKKYRTSCPGNEKVCEIARFETDDTTRMLDESMLEGDIYIAELQRKCNDLRRSFGLNEM